MAYKYPPELEFNEFDAVVDVNGNGDFLTINAAFTAGHRKIGLLDGTHSIDTSLVLADGDDLRLIGISGNRDDVVVINTVAMTDLSALSTITTYAMGSSTTYDDSSPGNYTLNTSNDISSNFAADDIIRFYSEGHVMVPKGDYTVVSSTTNQLVVDARLPFNKIDVGLNFALSPFKMGLFEPLTIRFENLFLYMENVVLDNGDHNYINFYLKNVKTDHGSSGYLYNDTCFADRWEAIDCEFNSNGTVRDKNSTSDGSNDWVSGWDLSERCVYNNINVDFTYNWGAFVPKINNATFNHCNIDVWNDSDRADLISNAIGEFITYDNCVINDCDLPTTLGSRVWNDVLRSNTIFRNCSGIFHNKANTGGFHFEFDAIKVENIFSDPDYCKVDTVDELVFVCHHRKPKKIEISSGTYDLNDSQYNALSTLPLWSDCEIIGDEDNPPEFSPKTGQGAVFERNTPDTPISVTASQYDYSVVSTSRTWAIGDVIFPSAANSSQIYHIIAEDIVGTTAKIDRPARADYSGSTQYFAKDDFYHNITLKNLVYSSVINAKLVKIVGGENILLENLDDAGNINDRWLIDYTANARMVNCRGNGYAWGNSNFAVDGHRKRKDTTSSTACRVGNAGGINCSVRNSDTGFLDVYESYDCVVENCTATSTNSAGSTTIDVGECVNLKCSHCLTHDLALYGALMADCTFDDIVFSSIYSNSPTPVDGGAGGINNITFRNITLYGDDFATGVLSPTSTVRVVNSSIMSVDATSTINLTNKWHLENINCKTSIDTVVITLPSSVNFPDRTIRVKDVDGNASTNNITINRAGTDLIDGQTSFVLDSNYGGVILISDGNGNWSIQ